MSFLLKDTFHNSLVETVYEDILSGRSIYYYFVGRILEWADETNPDTPGSTDSYEYDTRNSILSIKKVQPTDVSLVVPRRDWKSGIVYDQYDGQYSVDYPASSGATSIKTANFYVLTTEFNVYKCLYNYNGIASTFKPVGTNYTPDTYADGYIWQYLYTIPLSLRNRFLTIDFLPVQKSIHNQFYSGGEVETVIIDNAGTGYLGNASTTLTVNGTFIGRAGNAIANIRPVFNETGQFLNIVIDSAGNNYSNASIIINDTRGLGTSYYKGLSNVLVSNVGASYSTAAIANTTGTVSTTGASQPTSNAKVTLNFNNTYFTGAVITNKGSGYNTNVIANTVLTIATTGASQPTINARANISFTSTAVLTPIIYNNQIAKVLIEDPGTNYGTNNQTFISLIGDGTGAALTPFVNAAGQVEDIIIESRGSGYTYLDLTIVGDGTSANAHVDFSTGDLDTQQSTVELSAIDGALYAFRVYNVGNNYSNATISVTGDGTGFIGNVIVLNNRIDYISVVNPGSGYHYANVIITGPAGSEGANVSAIISPINGHGFNPVKELHADTIMLYTTINDESNQGVAILNDYRQFGIIKDVKQYANSKIFANVIGSSCFLITVVNIGILAADTLLNYSTDSSIKFEIVDVVSSTNQILINSKNSHILVAGDVLNEPLTNSNFEVTAVNKYPTINKFSGDLLYIDNRTSVSYSDEQLVKLRTVIKL